MVAAYTTADLLTRVKARAQIADADARLTTADILAVADDVIRSTIGRVVYNADDGRSVRAQADVAITSGISGYRLPSRAVGAGSYDVLIVDANGNELSSSYVDSADVWRFRGAYATATDGVYAHTIEGDTIVLLPTPNATAKSLRVKYRRRPSRLVTVAECGPITAVASDTVLTCTHPTAWSDPSTLDIVQGTSGGDALLDDTEFDANTTNIELQSGTLATTGAYVIAAGDYACLAGETCVLPLPSEAMPLLTVLVAYEVVTILGDEAAVAALERLVSTRREELQALMHERSRERQAIIPRHSHLRGGGRGTRQWWSD